MNRHCKMHSVATKLVTGMTPSKRSFRKSKSCAPSILLQPPPGANIIPSGYAFQHKRNEEGKIVQYKARLFAKGYRQQFGVDYSDTYAPTVRPSTLHTLLSLAVQNPQLLSRPDIKNAYLNVPLKPDEVIYMRLPASLWFLLEFATRSQGKTRCCM